MCLLINVFFLSVLIKGLYVMYWFMLDLQGLICSPLYCIGAAVAVAVGCGRDSRIRGRIGLWVFVPLVIVCSIVCGSLLLRTFETVFYTDMLLNL
jgi:hypothetical protein